MPFISSENRIFVINLDHQTERLRKITSLLKQEGLFNMHERFSPVQSSEIDENFMKKHNYELFPNFELKNHKNKYFVIPPQKP